MVEGRSATVAAAVEELSHYLIGQDPIRIEDDWQVLTKGRRVAAVRAAIGDHADIAMDFHGRVSPALPPGGRLLITTAQYGLADVTPPSGAVLSAPVAATAPSACADGSNGGKA